MKMEESKVRPYRQHIFLCVDSCCREKGSEGIFSALSEELKGRGLSNDVMISRCGCLDQCESGPMLVIYPEGIWYHNLKKEDVRRLVDEHLIKGNILPDLVYHRVSGIGGSSYNG